LWCRPPVFFFFLFPSLCVGPSSGAPGAVGGGEGGGWGGGGGGRSPAIFLDDFCNEILVNDEFKNKI